MSRVMVFVPHLTALGGWAPARLRWGDVIRIYISSTTLDLRDYRAAVISALRKAGHVPMCMEDYAAQDMLPIDKCLTDVASAELYVGILGFRYGFVPPSHECSVTELEFREAQNKQIPTLLFLAQHSVNWPAEHLDRGAAGERIASLREEAQLSRMVDFFTQPDQLASLVLAAVAQHERQVHYARIAAPQAPGTTRLEDLMGAAHSQTSAMMAGCAADHAIQAVPVCLPNLHGLFVDREAERATLHNWLTTEHRSLVAIVAPAGLGKTELTAKLLQEVTREADPGTVKGILYLRCHHGDLSLGRVFEHAGRITGRTAEFQAMYANAQVSLTRKLEFLFSETGSSGRVWIVLDNFEDMLDPQDDSIADEEIRAFFEFAADSQHSVHLIATSRVLPRFRGSRALSHIDLSVGLPEEEAVRFLREEGRQFGLLEADEDLLRTFAKRVHGIPKALESVLGYLEDHYPSITLVQLLADEELFADFDRHDTANGLKRLVAEQYQALSVEAQLVLSVVSIFRKPASESALSYLLPGLAQSDLARILVRLERNRLLTRNNASFTLHPIVRECAYSVLPAESAEESTDDTGTLLDRKSLHACAARYYHEMRLPEADWRSIADLEAPLEEFHHLVESIQYDKAATVVNAIDTLDYNYLQLWGYQQLVISMREQLVGQLVDSKLEAVNSGILGRAYMDTARYREAIAAYKVAVDMATADGDEAEISRWLGNLGNGYYCHGQIERGLGCHLEALEIARRLGDRRRKGVHLCNAALSYSALGEKQKALEYQTAALAIDREHGEARGECINLGYVGNYMSALGRVEEAIQRHQEALAIARRIGYRLREGMWLARLGEQHALLGDHTQAEALLSEARAISAGIGDRRDELACMVSLAEIAFSRQRLAEALDLSSRALDEAREIEYPLGISRSLAVLAQILHHGGDVARAITHYAEICDYDIIATSPAAYVRWGLATLECGNNSAAKVHFGQGVARCEKLLQATPGLYEPRLFWGIAELGMGILDGGKRILEGLAICDVPGVRAQVSLDLALAARCSELSEIAASVLASIEQDDD